MSIQLEKNSTISLTKTEPNLTNLTVGLGWDVAKPKGGFFKSLFSGTESIDLDASCLLISKNKQVKDTVWFRKLTSDCQSVRHTGDNLTGKGDGDDEQIKVDLAQLPDTVHYIAVTVNSFTGQNFNAVDNAFCRIMDQNNRELCRFTLREQGNHTGIFIGLLSKQGNEWTFQSKGVPTQGKTVQDIAKVVLKNL